MKPEYHIVSFSGGKDSTAMLLHMLELNMAVDEIIFCDTGIEFPEMYEHIDAVEKYIGRNITRLKSEFSFEYLAFEKTVKGREKGKFKGTKGYGWGSPINRWCTHDLKTIPRRNHLRPLQEAYSIIEYVGIASDEGYRLKRKNNQAENQRHPLVDWGWAESKCLQYCRERGFTWGGLYDLYPRVNCWCCPLQRDADLRVLRHHFPELWQKLREWDKRAYSTFRMGYITVEDLERRFSQEDLQGGLFDET